MPADLLGVMRIRRLSGRNLGLVAAPALLALPASAQATTASCTGATSNDWATAANWSCACVPSSGDTVDITGRDRQSGRLDRRLRAATSATAS